MNNPDGATYLLCNLNSAVKHSVAKTVQTGYSNETLYGNLHEILNSPKRMGMTFGAWGCSQHGRSTHNATGTNMTETQCPYVTIQMEAHTPLLVVNTPA